MRIVDTGSADPHWSALVHEVRARSDDLREIFMRGFPVEEKYGPNAVTPEDVREVVDDSLEMFLLLLQDQPLPSRLQSFPERLGTRRARQGVDEMLLLEGVRTNFTVLWDAFREAARPVDPQVLVDHVDLLLRLVEQHVARVQRAYLGESQRLDRDSRRLTDHLLTQFIANERPDRPQIAELASALGVGKDQQLWVALLASSVPPSNRLLESWRFHTPWQGLTVLLSPDAEAPPIPSATKGILTRHPSPLNDIPELVREMVHLSAVLQHDELVVLDDLLLRHAQAQTLERLGEPAIILGRGFFEARPIEQTRLLETLRAFVNFGSIGGTANQLFCHRNTVVTRLKRMMELTGYDPLVPREMAVLALLLGIW
ncbi:MAG: helix-turn-helix domain-containing protein [Leucobacter sp.]